MYEAVGLAIDRFRRCEQVKYLPNGLHWFIVESREPGTQHRLTRICSMHRFSGPAGRPRTSG
jgi:hypothetical protein